MKTILTFCSVLIVATALPAYAQATRTWVSGVGDDANPCSRTAPCKTFAGAISKTAAGGYIDALDPGGFGAVTITKSITIDGGPGVAGVLAAGTNGINVAAASTDTVVLRNLSIEGAGTGLNGIQVTGAAAVHVENCVIKGFTKNGIYSTASSGYLFVSDTRVSNIPMGQGVYVLYGIAILTHVSTDEASVGVLIGTGATGTVTHSSATGNAIGYAASYASSAMLNVEDSAAVNNTYGIFAAMSATARVSNSSVFNNSRGLYNDGSASIMSSGNNRFAGNAIDGTFTGTILIQ